MPRKYRALREDFVRDFDGAKQFPREQAFDDWAAKYRGGGFKNGSYSQLREGSAVPVRLVDAFVAYCCRPMLGGGDSPQKTALRAYCALRGLDDAILGSLIKTVDLISSSADASHRDPLMSGSDFVRTLCDRGQQLLESIRPCPSEAGVRDAVEWMYVDYGRQISRPVKLSYDEAREQGERAVRLSLKDYQARAISWWRYEPWTVALAYDRGDIVGMSIGLPVTEERYRRVKDGHINTWEIRTADLRSPSQYLITESVAMTPHRGPATDRKPSAPLAVSMVAQLAYLTTVENLGETVPLRVLTCGFSYVALRRAATFNFAPTGTLLHGTDMPILERVIHIKGKGLVDGPIWGNWRTVQLNLGGPRPLKPHALDTGQERP
jgi:hypothetical protein